jgi:hypothetical protein
MRGVTASVAAPAAPDNSVRRLIFMIFDISVSLQFFCFGPDQSGF